MPAKWETVLGKNNKRAQDARKALNVITVRVHDSRTKNIFEANVTFTPTDFLNHLDLIPAMLHKELDKLIEKLGLSQTASFSDDTSAMECD